MSLNLDEINKSFEAFEKNVLTSEEAIGNVISKNDKAILLINDELGSCNDETQASFLKNQKNILYELNTILYSIKELNIGSGVPKYDFNVENQKISDLLSKLNESSQKMFY